MAANVPFEFMVAFRYLRAHRKAGISLTSFLTVAGVMLGVAALTVVTSVWNGFETAFLSKLLGVNAHAVILKRSDVFRDHEEVAERLRVQPGITRVSPFIYNEVIVQSARGVQGVVIKGIDPDQTKRSDLAQYIAREDEDADRVLDGLHTQTGTAHPGMLVGNDLLEILHIEVGDTVTIISPYGSPNSEAGTASFTVVGTFHSGMFEFDSRWVFIDLKKAQSFFGLYGTVTGLEAWTEDPMTSKELLNAAVRPLDPTDPVAFTVKDWSQTNRGVFGAVNQQKTLITLVLFIIVLVAAFNIMATLFLLILEKGREIALLKSLGAKNRSILAIFVIDGQLVGLVGCALGLGVGLAVCALLGRYGLKLDPRVYYLENLPVVVNPWELLLIVGGAMLLATLATTFPALTAARLKPVEGLTRRGQTRRRR